MGHVCETEVVNCTQQEPVLSQQLLFEVNRLSADDEGK